MVVDRIEQLLSEMTLAEKVGQLSQVVPARTADIEDRIRAGRIGSIFGISDVAQVERYQRLAAQESRLGIPLVVGNDVIHGYRTVFPIPLAEASTWDPRLLEQAARVAADEAYANGTDWIFAPMVDICRDPRWGRIAEGAGEDPFLGSRMAEARVRGFQASGQVAACPKHYVAYGAAEAGRDYNSVDISERALRDVLLPPFKAGVDAGAQTLMSSFNDIAGIPATINTFTLRNILRNEWDWPGVVVSDYTAIAELIQHGVAADLEQAARLSMLAGVDIDMMSGAYDRHLATLVEEGSVPLERVDEAVHRVLALKLRLGLFERLPRDRSAAARALLTEEHRQLALQVAQESMVLLKNDGLLPLARGTRVALAGPLAEARKDLLGCWSPFGREEDVESVLDEVAGYASITGSHEAADVIIAVVGESADMSGEAHSRAHLHLPVDQQALIDRLAETGKPLVVVLMSGRPLVIPRMAQQANALLAAWHGGIRAGRAVADVLFGSASPSGHLTASWPRATGQIPLYYAHKNTGRPAQGEGTRQFEVAFKSTYIDESNSPLFPFGFGLSYTSFAYTDLIVEPPHADHIVAGATVQNTGGRAGTEVVQLYVRDLVASVTRPVRELKGFERVHLEPGESRRVRFELPTAELGFTGLDMRYVVEPGAFQLWIGPDATRGLEGGFALDADQAARATSSNSISSRQ